MRGVLLTLLFAIGYNVSIAQITADSVYLKLKNDLELTTTKVDRIKALMKLGSYSRERDMSLSELYFLEAERLVNEKDASIEDKTRASLYNRMGIVQRRKGDYSKAISYYQKAIDLYEHFGNTVPLSMTLHNLGLAYRMDKDYDNALRVFKRSLILKKQNKDSLNIARTYNQLGMTYRDIAGDDISSHYQDSVRYYLNQGKHLFDGFAGKKTRYFLIGYRIVKSGLAHLDILEGNYEEGLSVFFDILEEAKQNSKKSLQCSTYREIALAYQKKKQYNRSLRYLDSSLAIAQQQGYNEQIAEIFRQKSVVQSEANNFRDAISSYKLYKVYYDSVYDVNKAKKIQQLTSEFEFEKEREALEIVVAGEKKERQFYAAMFLIALSSGSILIVLLRRNHQHKTKIAEDKLLKKELEKELLNEKIGAAQSDMKFIAADHKLRLSLKKELLEQLKQDQRLNNHAETKKYIQNLILKLNQQVSTEGRLTLIQDKLDEVNNGFYEKLMTQYPSLTKGEREMCTLLRLNLTTKEIATIRNASVDAIKAIRYRIRKKLDLNPGEELEYFVQSLA